MLYLNCSQQTIKIIFPNPPEQQKCLRFPRCGSLIELNFFFFFFLMFKKKSEVKAGEMETSFFQTNKYA